MCAEFDLLELEKWLEQFLNFEQKPDWEMLKLDAMETMVEKFGHPERFCPCFHVAGSKGKGTISANIAGILREVGYKTGVYASPHILHYTERVGTGERAFSKEIYDRTFQELRLGVEELFATEKLNKNKVTWYELSTMFAMLCFREAKVDYVVYEVGLGGRLDATNIIMPKCAIFGPIELEHTDYLGETLAEIAGEKAGIIKDRVPVVSVFQTPEVRKALEEKARLKRTKIEFLAENKDYVQEDIEVAWRSVQKILPTIPREVAERGVEKVKLSGRFERITKLKKYPHIPYVLLDVAHTPHSVNRVLERMQNEKIYGKLLFGCAIDKDVKTMARLIKESGLFERVYLTRPGEFKPSDLNEEKRAFEAVNMNVVANDDYLTFIPRVFEDVERDAMPLVVMGSFYLVREVKSMLDILA